MAAQLKVVETDSGNMDRQKALEAALPPIFCASAMAWSASVVLPELSGP